MPLLIKKPDRMRTKQQSFAYEHYNRKSKDLALKQLLKRRNVLSMKDSIA
jgi:hypothetical protein